MAKLYLRNAYEFENPSRRVFKEGGGELFGSASGQAAKINAWVGGKESSSEAKALAESVSKQAEEIREGTRKELLELYVNVFTSTIQKKETYNVAPLTVDSTYAKNGLLQVLEKNSSDLRIAFTSVPDLRLLSYATIYQNFKAQGLDVNYLPIGAEVKLVNGDVTVTYTENGVVKTATSEIFPWSTYESAQKKYGEFLAEERAERAREIEAEGGPREDEELREILAEPTPGAPEAPKTKVPEMAEERDAMLKEEWLTKIKPQLQALETQFPGVKITLTDASFDKKENKPTDEVDPWPNYGKHGKTVEIHYGPKKTDVKRYQIIVPKEANSYLDPSVTINKDVEKGLGVTWEPMAHSETENILDIFAGEADAAIKKDVEDAIVVGDIARLNELTPSQQLYYLDWYVSRTLGMAQKDPRTLTKAEQKEMDEFYSQNVVMEVSEKWYLELNARPDLDPVTRASLELTAEKIRALQELRRAHPYEGMNKKEVAEYDMKSLFTDFNGSPESWQKVDTQYKKMRQTMPEGRISALDHYRGSEAAARAGRIDEAIALLDLAAKNAGDGTYEKADAVANQESLRKKYGTISLNEPTNRYFTYTPAPGAEGELYTVAALEHAKTELQKNGHFEGRVPLGTYEVGGTKVYTVTAEGTTVRDKTAPEAAPAASTEVSLDEAALKQKAQLAADALELSTFMGPESVVQGLKGYRQRAGNEAYWFMSQFQDGDFSYVIMENRNLPEPSMDGSVEWSVDFRTVEGDTFRVTAEAKAVDIAQVKAYREAQLARGINYSEEDLITYLAYRTVSQEFKTNIEETRNNVALNKKYMAYLAANRPEVNQSDVDELVIPPAIISFPGLPEGDYSKAISSLELDDEAPVSGNFTLTCVIDGTIFQGPLKDNVPDGIGGIWLRGSEMMGPLVFEAGKASVNLPDGSTKDITWNSTSGSFDVTDVPRP